MTLARDIDGEGKAKDRLAIDYSSSPSISSVHPSPWESTISVTSEWTLPVTPESPSLGVAVRPTAEGTSDDCCMYLESLSPNVKRATRTEKKKTLC